MSHVEQRAFCAWVKNKFPQFFTKGTSVLDCGSLDINGNNRWLFDEPLYWGIDIGDGPNVDQVVAIHELYDEWAGAAGDPFDVVISTEMLEHDVHYQASLRAMVSCLRSGGLLVFTCATTGRAEHGTARTTPSDSPVTQNYYRNLTPEDIRAIPGFLEYFSEYQFLIEERHCDLCFYGIKEL